MRRHLPELSLAFGMMLVGVALGAATVTATPETLVAAYGIGALMVAYDVWSHVSEDRFHRSPALGLAFDAIDDQCVFPFPGGLLLRLRVTNLRSRSISEVRIKVLQVRGPDGRDTGLNINYLKWRHDDTPEHRFSLEGTSIDGGAADYMDLAQQEEGQPGFYLVQVPPHLIAQRLLGGPYAVDLLATGRDAGTSAPVPERRKTLLIGPDSAGLLTVWEP